MYKRYLIYLFFITVVISVGYYLGKSHQEELNAGFIPTFTSKNQPPTNKLPLLDNSNNTKQDANNTSDNLEQKNVSIKNKFYKNNKYFNSLLKNKSAKYIFDRALILFKDKPNKEDMAIWLMLAVPFDDSNEYGELLTYAFNELNQNNQQTYQAIIEVIKNLPPQDSFIRGQILNLANSLSLDRMVKVEFFGRESARKVVLDEQRRFSPDSLNITTSIALLSQNQPTTEQVQDFIKKSFEQNKDPEIRKKLIVRFSSYFPELKDEF